MERNERLKAADKCASRYTDKNEARIARSSFMLGCEFEAQGEAIKGVNLESEKPMNQEGLDEEINRLWESFADEMEGPHNLFDIYARLARHFAQWGAEHLANSNDEVVINGHKVEYDKDKDAITMEEIPNELEEAAMNYIAPIENEDGLKVINFSGQDIKDAFIAGAKWQKQHDAELIEIAYNDGITIGMTKQREQMMKEAVEGTVYGNGDYTWVAGDIPSQFKYGDKVRIIVCKKEDEK